MVLTTAAGHHNSDAPNVSLLFILSTKLWPSICGSFGVSQNYPHFDLLVLVHICHAFTIEQPHKQDQCILLFCLSLLECFTPKSAHPLHVLVSSGTHAWLPRICPLVCNQPPVSLPLHPNIYDNRRKKNRLRNSNRILFWSFGQAFGHPPFPLLGSKDALPSIGLLVRFALERQRLYQCTQTILMLKLCLFGQS